MMPGPLVKRALAAPNALYDAGLGRVLGHRFLRLTHHGRRSWLDARGRPAHHLLDPATGRPAFTGVVQATALAPTALEAEIRAKAAVLSGPDDAAGWLPHGGAVVLEDRTVEVLPAGTPGLAGDPRPTFALPSGSSPAQRGDQGAPSTASERFA